MLYFCFGKIESMCLFVKNKKTKKQKNPRLINSVLLVKAIIAEAINVYD
jgi:hypothetical protein